MKDNRDAIDFANEPVGHIFRQLLVPTVVGMLSIVISIHLSRGEAKAANINATQAFIGCLAITILCCVLILGNLAGTCRLFGSSETGIWLAIPLAEFLTFILIVCFTGKSLKNQY